MCYYVLNQNGEVVRCSTVWRVTQLELHTDELGKTFDKHDLAIKVKMKEKEIQYEGAKPNPKDWADLMEHNKDF